MLLAFSHPRQSVHTIDCRENHSEAGGSAGSRHIPVALLHREVTGVISVVVKNFPYVEEDGSLDGKIINKI